MAAYGTLITWSEITGSTPTITDLHALIEPYLARDVLVGIARLAARFRTWQNAPDAAFERQLALSVFTTHRGKLQEVFAGYGDRILFSRITLLFVAKQALRACRLNGEGATGSDTERLLTSCLMANDLLLGREPLAEDSTIDKAANLLTFSSYVPQNTYPNDLARSLLLVERIGPLLTERPDYIDLAAAFERAAGLSPVVYCNLAFGIATKFLANIEEQFSHPATGSVLILNRDYFRNASIAEGDVKSFFDKQTRTVRELVDLQAASKSADNDFLLFQQYPLIEIDVDSYVCIDAGFLLDKAGRSFYWTIHGGLQSQKERLHLLGYWAGAIERYVQWLFQQTYQRPAPELSDSPKFPDGSEGADILLRESGCVAFFEVKASVLTADAKYRFDGKLLRSELTKKAIEGDPGGRKGVAQLRHNLKRFIKDGAALNGLTSQRAGVILPVLVFLDDSFVAPYMNMVYNEAFDRADLCVKGGPTVASVFSITVNDLEEVLPHTDGIDLTEILREYNRNNPNRFGGLLHGLIPCLQKRQRGRDLVRERFAQFGDEIRASLFPGE